MCLAERIQHLVNEGGDVVKLYEFNLCIVLKVRHNALLGELFTPGQFQVLDVRADLAKLAQGVICQLRGGELYSFYVSKAGFVLLAFARIDFCFADVLHQVVIKLGAAVDIEKLQVEALAQTDEEIGLHLLLVVESSFKDDEGVLAGEDQIVESHGTDLIHSVDEELLNLHVLAFEVLEALISDHLCVRSVQESKGLTALRQKPVNFIIDGWRAARHLELFKTLVVIDHQF